MPYLLSARIRIFLAALCCLLVAGCTQHSKVTSDSDNATEDCPGSFRLSAPDSAAVMKEINGTQKIREIEEIFNKKRQAGFNGNVLIAQKGVVLYEKSFGYSKLKQKDTLTAASAFQLASLSKPFTALAILRLQEEGKLSLEDSVERFFPGFPYPGIRVRSLLSHRSGLPNYAYVFTDSVRKVNHYPHNPDIIRWFSRVKPKPYHLPDRHFNYSNTNYCLLASIVEKASGQSFGAYLQDHIFTPLKMENSYLLSTMTRAQQPFKTAGHQHGREIPKDNYDDVVGDKGIYATTGDLYRLYRGLMNGCIISRATMDEAFMPRSFEREGKKNYGYGFRMHLGDDRKAAYIYHGGWWKGYNTMMWMSPDDDFVIIILGNSYNRTVYQIKEIVDVLQGKVQPDDIEQDL